MGRGYLGIHTAYLHLTLNMMHAHLRMNIYVIAFLVRLRSEFLYLSEKTARLTSIIYLSTDISLIDVNYCELVSLLSVKSWSYPISMRILWNKLLQSRNWRTLLEIDFYARHHYCYVSDTTQLNQINLSHSPGHFVGYNCRNNNTNKSSDIRWECALDTCFGQTSHHIN